MPTTVYESHYLSLILHEKENVMESRWHYSDQMSVETYKKEILHQAEYIRKHGVKGVLIDTSNFLFTITPELQEWTASHIIPLVATSNVRKNAFLTSPDLFTQLSIEQTMDEVADEDSPIKAQYFSQHEPEKAIAWLAQD